MGTMTEYVELFVLFARGEVYSTLTSEWEARSAAGDLGHDDWHIVRYSPGEIVAFGCEPGL